ncbi:MAG TPA: ABC transporter substrate-binding protein [Verrucomicrobiae bacterium]|nr:ABC transporter substrate-binding protein [Verrucomicrobiae bacterium]
MNLERRVGLPVVAALLLTSMSLTVQTTAPKKIKLLTLLGKPVQFVIAERQGYFAKHGVSAQTENLPSSDVLRSNLASGNGDLAYLAVDNAVAMVELAHQDMVILMGGEGSQNELVVQPEIKSLEQLRGKTLIVDAPNTAYALQLKKILLAKGLQVVRDYEMKPVGGTPQRLIAMREHKEYAGSMLGPPALITAKQEGFVSLAKVQDVIGPYQGAGYFSQRKWALDNKENLDNYLAAIIEAHFWLMDPANKQQVIDLWISEFHMKPEIAAATYESSVNAPGGFEKGAALDLDGFKNVLQLRAEMEGQWGGHPPGVEKYYDPSFYNTALKKASGGK